MPPTASSTVPRLDLPILLAHPSCNSKSGPLPMTNPEDELEIFRQAWRDEVSRRAPQAAGSGAGQSSSSKARQKQSKNPQPAAGPAGHQDTEIEPHTYHDVEEKDGGRRIGDEQPAVEPSPPPPLTALEHYERAVEREGEGNLGESLFHYRRAFKASSCLNCTGNANRPSLTLVFRRNTRPSMSQPRPRLHSRKHQPPSLRRCPLSPYRLRI